MALGNDTLMQSLASYVLALRGSGGEKLFSAQLGMPASLSAQVMCYIMGASRQASRDTFRSLLRAPRFNVTFAYRLDGSETSAEQTLTRLADAFELAQRQDVTLGGLCLHSELDFALADAPEYQTWSGKEAREYPILVTLQVHTDLS